MSRLNLSNLQLRSNLLSEDGYQKEMHQITSSEVKDILARNPNLMYQWDKKQRQQQTESLFDGTRGVGMSDGDRDRAWVELLAQDVEAALGAIEKHPELERAFEILCITETLAAPDLDSTYAVAADAWARRVRAVLGRGEFHLESGMIDQRLAEILGRSRPPGAAARAERPVAISSPVNV